VEGNEIPGVRPALSFIAAFGLVKALSNLFAARGRVPSK
jgi:hypothetical protein